jgi:hydroxyacylglutathione hydrolase
MDLQIQMLGTGNAFAKKYYNTNALVTCEGYTLLVDCGFTAHHSLHELRFDLTRIDGIFITHLHADHVGGLEEFAFKMMYQYNRKPTLFVPDTLLDPLWNETLKGGLDNPAEGITRLDDYFHVKTVETGSPFEIAPGFTIETRATRHIPGKYSYSLIINAGLFYSADTKFDRELIDYVYHERNCKYMLHDCQLANPGVVHATLDELMTLPREIKERIMLMHYNDDKEHYVGKTDGMPFVEQHRLYKFELAE